jgi:hypothetical protein
MDTQAIAVARKMLKMRSRSCTVVGTIDELILASLRGASFMVAK